LQRVSRAVDSQAGESAGQTAQCGSHLEAGEWSAEAIVDALSEPQVGCDVGPPDVDLIGVGELIRVAVG
jgi:hypothetical protein